jgi:methyl-branched lipid omega-hydroxylase
MPDYRTVDDIFLGDVEFWARPIAERHAAFAALRAETRRGGGMCFHEEISILEGNPQGPGFWSAVTYEDVQAVSRNQAVFSSASGITMNEPVPEALQIGSIINMDDPRHGKFRRLVQKAFTPRMVASVEESVRARACRLVESARETGGACDFVEAFAAPLPLQVICDMLGIPPEDERQIFQWTNDILDVGDPEFPTDLDQLMVSIQGMVIYAHQLAEQRAARPGDDISSVLMQAEVDGERLTPMEFACFFALLAIAGNETTRNAISWGMKLLTDHPDQRALLQANYAELAPNAAEEMVRWASPVIHMRRIALDDVQVGDTKVAAGDKVVMWYWSANRDEGVFEDGDQFDIRRVNAMDMVGFGAGGTHFCLGANLARREIQVMFEEILTGLPDLQITGEPDRLMSGFINGIKRMPCEFTVS